MSHKQQEIVYVSGQEKDYKEESAWDKVERLNEWKSNVNAEIVSSRDKKK